MSDSSKTILKPVARYSEKFPVHEDKDTSQPQAKQTQIVAKEDLELKAHIQFAKQASEHDQEEIAHTIDSTDHWGMADDLVENISYVNLIEDHDSENRALEQTERFSQVQSSSAVPARYMNLGRLGKGGMGEVFSVQDRLLKREVALKRVHDVSSPKVQEAFIREARILAQLNHPSIVPIHDLFVPQNIEESQVTACFTMEKVDGVTLSTKINHFCECDPQAGSDLLYELLNIFVSIGEAIKYAHERGVIHRDLKPDNVMIGEHGQVKVLDWGLGGQMLKDSKESIQNHHIIEALNTIYPNKSNFTFTGTISGTPAYMSPEQARGDQLTEQTDVYALGAILYEILTGYAPYVKEFMNESHCAWLIIEQVKRASEPPPLKREFCPHPHLVNRYLTKICDKALHPDVQKRYQSVENLISDIKNYLSGGTQRSQIQETKARVQYLYAKSTEQMSIQKQAKTQWERLEILKNIPLTAHFRSQVLHYLEDLVRWDRSDIEARLWGIHLRYHFIQFLWWRGELDTAYQITKDVLADRAAKLEVYKEAVLGSHVPWREIDILKNQSRKLYLHFDASKDDRFSLSLFEIPRLDHQVFAREFSQTNKKRQSFQQPIDLALKPGQPLELDLPWGRYALKVTVVEGVEHYTFFKLFIVSPPTLVCFENPQLLTIFEYEELARSYDPEQNILSIYIDFPKQYEDFSPYLISQSTPNLTDFKQEHSILIDEAFTWIASHEFTGGTWLPISSTLPSQEYQCGKFWVQKGQVTCQMYIHYLNTVLVLARSLTQDEQNQALIEIQALIPTMKQGLDDLLFSHENVNDSYDLSSQAIDLGITLDTPIFNLSFIDIERFLLVMTWESGIPWSLLSETEWELAARGIDQRTFPWGDQSPQEMAHMNSSELEDYTIRSSHLPVSPLTLFSRAEYRTRYPNDLSPFLIEGMGGGVAEWTMKDALKSEKRLLMKRWCAVRPDENMPIETKARMLFNAAEWRSTFQSNLRRTDHVQVIKGGSYQSTTEQCTTMYRTERPVDRRRFDTSFRLVLAP